MEIKYVRVDYNNSKTGSSKTNEHQNIIANMLNENYSYLGFIPVKMGPSGKILSIDLIFKK